MQSDPETLEELVQQVCENDKYAAIDLTLIRSLGRMELQKRSSLKEAVKSTRNKLHQVGSAYQEKPIPYAALLKEMAELPADLNAESTRSFLTRTMQLHASTGERLNIHETFFAETLADLGPLHSILDLACGLNPLNLPWMPTAPDLEYSACDIYTDMLEFLDSYFTHFSIHGQANSCDLTQTIPRQKVQLALLLKTIPCLEQIDKNAGARLLSDLQADNILVTFPAHSLGGRSKGMVQNYSEHFSQLTAGQPWQIRRFDFPGELAFLIRK
jgi:16S rRNA (guanine(1405)-N(7))-methyltransferase